MGGGGISGKTPGPGGEGSRGLGMLDHPQNRVAAEAEPDCITRRISKSRNLRPYAEMPSHYTFLGA